MSNVSLSLRKKVHCFSLILNLFVCLFSSYCFAEEDNAQIIKKDNDLVKQFLLADSNNTIVFDANNIKQYWIDNSVISRKDSFEICLNRTNHYASIPLKIQMANVNIYHNCFIKVVSDDKDFSFSISNSRNKVLSHSKNDTSFLQFHVLSSLFHWEDIGEDQSFYITFSSNSLQKINIYAISLSFGIDNEGSYLVSPGVLSITKDKLRFNAVKHTEDVSDKSYKITGARSISISNKKIIVSNNIITTNVSIKNSGNTTTTVYIALRSYTKDHVYLRPAHYPLDFIDKKLLKVISVNQEKNSIVVDHLPVWRKGAKVAFNAMDNFSDVPNTNILNGDISDVKTMTDGCAEITMTQPLSADIQKDMNIRIHSSGGQMIYLASKVLQPGEEFSVSKTISKDDNCIEYSHTTLTKGVYYIEPTILSYSNNPEEDNTITISNYTVTY